MDRPAQAQLTVSVERTTTTASSRQPTSSTSLLTATLSGREDNSGVAALLHEAMELTIRGQYHRALEYLRQYLAVGRRENNHAVIGRALRNIGVVYLHLKQPKKAVDFLMEGLKSTRENATNTDEGGGDGHDTSLVAAASEAKVLMHIGVAYYQQGQLDIAIAYHQEAMARADACGNLKLSGAAREQMAQALTKMGNYTQALAHLERAAELARNANDDEGLALALKATESVVELRNKYRKARRAIELRR